MIVFIILQAYPNSILYYAQGIANVCQGAPQIEQQSENNVDALDDAVHVDDDDANADDNEDHHHHLGPNARRS